MVDGYGPLNLKDIKITDSLFGSYLKLVNEKMIPYQWDILNDRVKDAISTHCIDNFRIAAGEMKGEITGLYFKILIYINGSRLSRILFGMAAITNLKKLWMRLLT